MSNGKGPAKGYTPVEVHSANAFFPGTKFDKAFVTFQRRVCGVILVDKSVFESVGAKISGYDLTGAVMTGVAVLIDYNYILMCNHTFKSISTAGGNSAMSSGKVKVVFFNEITAATVDTKNPSAESNRPFALLRGDLEAWVGTNDSECNEDFAIVKIEWNGADFHKIQRSVKLPPPGFSSSSLTGKNICTILQYSASRPVPSLPKTSFSTHVAMGPVTAINQSPSDEFCSNKKSIYAYAEHNATFGSSGSPVLNEAGELVGILCGGGTLNSKRQMYFLPLDQVYGCKQVSRGITAGQHLTNIYNYLNKTP